jgi:mono/diheme cytochrome c family protein
MSTHVRQFAGALSLVCVVGSCSTEAASESPAPDREAAPVVDERASALSAGKALFESNCMSCHGAGALGDGPAAAALAVRPANILEHFGDHTYEDLVSMVAKGIPPAMPPAPISTDEIRLVLNYAWTMVPDSARGRIRALQELAGEEH